MATRSPAHPSPSWTSQPPAARRSYRGTPMTEPRRSPRGSSSVGRPPPGPGQPRLQRPRLRRRTVSRGCWSAWLECLEVRQKKIKSPSTLIYSTGWHINKVVLMVLLTSKQKLQFSTRSIYENLTFVLMSTEPREQPHVSPRNIDKLDVY